MLTKAIWFIGIYGLFRIYPKAWLQLSDELFCEEGDWYCIRVLQASSHSRHPNSLLPSAAPGCGWGRAAKVPAIAAGARQNLQWVDSTPKTSMHKSRNNCLIILVERGFPFLVPSQVCLFSLLSKQRQDCHNSCRHLLETEITSPL